MSESHAAEVQAELQQYLNSKNINSLFIAIVENLLIEKPSNPIAFMIEYLIKNYPDQAKVALDGNAPINPQIAQHKAVAAEYDHINYLPIVNILNLIVHFLISIEEKLIQNQMPSQTRKLRLNLNPKK